VGDSPVIGAGTYARDGACAVSGTGKGEFFIRYVVGHEVAARVSYLGQDLETAAGGLINDDLAAHDIGAGLVAVDDTGNISAPYNTPGMFRGWVTTEGKAFVATHEELYEIKL
jgi:beta-aspartyl-peptidase (threonine type)